MAKMMYVGADIDSKNITVCFIDELGKKLTKIRQWSNSPAGLEHLIQKSIQICSENEIEELIIGCEATSVYSFHFLNGLCKDKQLQIFNPKIYQINPRLIHNFKKSYPDSDKTDYSDAFVIADRLRFGRLPAPYSASSQNHLPLQRLTRHRFHIVHEINREKNYLCSQIFLNFSAYYQKKPLSNTLGATSKALLTEFMTADELAQTDLPTLLKLIVKKGKNRFTDPEDVLNKILAMAKESYRIRPELAKSVNLVITLTIKNINVLQKILKELDNAIKEEIKAFPNTLNTVPGIGPVYTAGIIAEIGDIHRFKKEPQLAKFAGLSWKKRQSSDYTAEETSFSKNSNKYLRYYLCQAANSLKNNNSEYRKYYGQKYKEALKHKHKRAIILSARKFCRLVYALLKSKKMYQLSIIPV